MQCSAKRSNGEPCTRRAISGGKVCYVHGGAAPQVKKAARERLAEMVDPALGVLIKAMKMKSKGSPVALAVTAARDVLDRAGYKATDKIQLFGVGDNGAFEVNVSAREMLARRIAELTPAEGADSSGIERTGS